MSLDDKVIKQHTDPLRREIDRLREVQAKLKDEVATLTRERDEAVAALEGITSELASAWSD